MTKHIFRLALMLVICGAMLGCKKADDPAEAAGEAAEPLKRWPKKPSRPLRKPLRPLAR